MGFGLLSDGIAVPFQAMDRRFTLSVIYPVNFAALAYVVTWLLLRGGQSTSPVARLAEKPLRWVFNHPFPRLLGRHSLQVYTFHMVLVFAMYALEAAAAPFTEVTKTLLTLGAIALLAVPAWLLEEGKARTRLALAQGAR
jgi:hypothetical protein